MTLETRTKRVVHTLEMLVQEAEAKER